MIISFIQFFLTYNKKSKLYKLYFIYVISSFSGSFYVLNFHFFSKSSPLFRCYFPFIYICLISDQDALDLSAALFFNFIKPLLYIIEWFPAADIKHNNCTYRSSIIRPGNGPKRLLACLIIIIITVSHIDNLTLTSLTCIIFVPNSTIFIRYYLLWWNLILLWISYLWNNIIGRIFQRLL